MIELPNPFAIKNETPKPSQYNPNQMLPMNKRNPYRIDGRKDLFRK
jgi:hypothetical protein